MTSTFTKARNQLKTPLSSYTGPMGGLFAGKSGTVQHMEAYGQVGTLFSIVHRTSTATSKVEWTLYRKRKPRQDKKSPRTEVTVHPALSIWNKPNDFMHQQLFIETFQQHLDLTGEGWWVLNYADGLNIPLEMYPVRPDRMTPIGGTDRLIVGYMYTAPNGEKIPLSIEEVIFLKMPNPMDLLRGMGPVQSVLADLDSVKYSAEWNRNFFANSAEPGGIIIAPTELSDTEFMKLQRRWNEQHKGVSRAHRVAILENGLEWKDRSYSQKDMQFVQLRNVSREIVMEAFGISKTMLGLTESVNRATAEAAEYVFAKYPLDERLSRIRGALNYGLLPLFGANDVEFDYECPVPEDNVAEAAELTSKVNAAVALIREGADPAATLEALDLPDIPFKEKAQPAQVVPPQPPVETTDPMMDPNMPMEGGDE